MSAKRMGAVQMFQGLRMNIRMSQFEQAEQDVLALRCQPASLRRMQVSRIVYISRSLGHMKANTNKAEVKVCELPSTAARGAKRKTEKHA